MIEDQNNADYSVLMSVYAKDNPDFLDEAIASMVNQTVPFHDMVVVCDGPLTDDLEQHLSAWKDKLGDRLSIVKLPENVGLGAALNKGLPECACDTVARMDADDLSRPNRCEILLTAMAAGDLDLVGGTIEEFDTVPGDLGDFRKMPETQEEIIKFAGRRNPFNHMSVMFNREKVLEAGGYEPFYLLEDYWLWARMLSKDCKCMNVPDVIIDARVGSGMYDRRSNIPYLKSQYKFFFELKKLGISSWGDVAITLGARTLQTIIPVSGVKALYKRFLRG